jgi:transcriptional regulator with XRE-family HTH domain
MKISRKERNVSKVVGKKIYIERLALGMTRNDLSEIIGISPQQLHKYEIGVNRITIDRLVVIMKFFNKPIDYFLSEAIKELDDKDKQSLNENDLKIGLDISKDFTKIKNLKQRKAVKTLINELANYK